MGGKRVRQRFFCSKEIQISISLIVLWSFLAVALIMYLAKEFSGALRHYGLFSVLAVLAGYLLVVVILTAFFSRRLIGPFNRLNSEINLIVAGQFKRRLRVRMRDDPSIRTFVTHVNKMLDELEENRHCSLGFLTRVQSEITGVLARLEEEDLPKEKVGDLLAGLQESVSSIIEEQKITP